MPIKIRKFATILCLALCASSSSTQVLIPSPNERAIAYQQDLFGFWAIEQAIVFAFSLLLLFSGSGAVIAHQCMRWSKNRWTLGAILFAGLYSAFYFLIRLPLEYARTLRLGPYFAEESSPPFQWMLEQMGPLLAFAAFGALAGWLLLSLIRRSKLWWVWSTAFVVAIASLNFMTQPLWVGESQTPIAESAFSEWGVRIEEIGRRSGETDLPVFVWATNSEDFCPIQNSVIGLGPTRRIVLADKIFTDWQPVEVDVAVAHELKHYLFDNEWLPIILLTALGLGGSLTVLGLGSFAIRRWASRFGFSSLGEPAALPLLVLSLQVYLLFAVPVLNRIAQGVELEADRFALEATRENEARAQVSARQCGDLWLPEDTLFFRLYESTHPSVADRIDLANRYRPWETGLPLKYFPR